MIDTAVSDTSASPFDEKWLAAVGKGLDDAERELLCNAVKWVDQPLRGTVASTGEPLVNHAAGTAKILADMDLDAAVRASALLAVMPVDLQSRSGVDEPMLKAFGAEVATLVQGVRALLRLGVLARQSMTTGEDASSQKEMQRKMLLAMAADLRIVLMRLASRLQSLRWYAASRTPCPPAFARETLELYTPLANRLGIWQIKWEMEDLAFRFLEPQIYKDIARRLEEKRSEREASIRDAMQALTAALEDAGIPAEVSGRPKHIYSIWNKMRNKDLDFSQLFDLRAMRVIVNDERACYAVLALVHSLWTPVPEEFDDYISRPKPNGYRSLHTVVTDAQGRTFEIQIRTREMHHFAEYGMAAHWRYKEAGPMGGEVAASGSFDQKVSWMRQLLAWGKGDAASVTAGSDAGQEDSATSGTKRKGSGKSEGKHASDERIYVMTPQARVIELPAGATPVDFAYHLHTDLGHRCRGARIDGQLVPLSTKLKTGQTVEIVAAKSGGPSRDWLNPQLGFLASQRSRAKVRAWFNAVELQQRIAQGQSLVEKELQRLGKTAVNLEQLAQQLGFAKADDLYVAVAKDEFSLRQIDHVLRGTVSASTSTDASGAPALSTRPSSSQHDAVKSGVLVVGVDSLMTQLARCCRPAPPDLIRGFVTRGRGVSIHRQDCSSFAALAQRQPERVIDVDWGDTSGGVYPVDISIRAQDSANLLHDLSEVLAKLRLRVTSINTQSRRSLTHLIFTIEVQDGKQIQKVLSALNELPGVQASRR